MLAKVVKNQAVAAAAFAPFSVPEIGAGKKSSDNHGAFVFPTIDEIQSAEGFSAGASAAADHEEKVQTARQQAADILAQAESDSEMIAQAAFEKGLSEARATIETEIAERVNLEAAALREQLSETVQKISALSEEILASVELDVVELALGIAKKVVEREVSLDREIACRLVKISLGKLHNRSVAEVRLHPEDFGFVEAQRERLGFRGSLALVEDASISPGGCLIHTETGDIDGRIESQFDEIAYGLLNG